MIYGINPSETRSSFSVCCDRGFAFYYSDPVKLKFERDFGKGIAQAEQWQDSNIVVLVGGGSDPMFPLTDVVIWDDHNELLLASKRFASDVKKILLTHNRLIVVLECEVIKLKFPPMDVGNELVVFSSFKTAPNPLGCASILNYPTQNILAIPSTASDAVLLVQEGQTKEFSQAYPMKYITPIEAISLFDDEKRKLKLMAISTAGGCSIDVWNICAVTPVPMATYYRSGTPARDISFAWDLSGDFLCVSSSSATIHYFDLKNFDPQGYFLNSNRAKFKVKLTSGVEHSNNKGYLTRCWFTRKSARLIVARVEEKGDTAFYEKYDEVKPFLAKNVFEVSTPLESYLLCDEFLFYDC